mgnify:CR=1 FL=1
MKVIPAVDLMGGRVVRLVRGRANSVLNFKGLQDPITAAERWVSEGADLIHVIDLDAALGRGSNTDLVMRMANSVKAKVQAGGGIRTLEKAVKLLEGGVWRIVVGTMAFKNPEALKALLASYGPERVAVAVDHSRGVVKVRGWLEETSLTVREAVEQLAGEGVEYFLVTDVDRDGTLSGVELDTLRGAVRVGVRVMAAGGVSTLSDIRKLKRVGVWGVIVGRALYEGRFTFREAVEAATHV